jgi:Subtilase family/Secretion system C-terminal sorting domain
MWPAAYDEVIAVGATDQNDIKSLWPNTTFSGSNYGNWVDVMAPGTAIHTTYSAFNCGTNTMNHNLYITANGTSEAAPIVAGLCGLIKSKNPSYTVAQIKQCLYANCDNIDAQNPTIIGQIGHGRINAKRALNCLTNGIAITANSSICGGGNATYTISIPSGVSYSQIYWSFPGGTCTNCTGNNVINPIVSYPTGGQYYASAYLVDGANTYFTILTSPLNVIGILPNSDPMKFTTHRSFPPYVQYPISILSQSNSQFMFEGICEGDVAKTAIEIVGSGTSTITYNFNGGSNQISRSTTNKHDIFTDVPITSLLNPINNDVFITAININGITCPTNEKINIQTIKCCPELLTDGQFANTVIPSSNTVFINNTGGVIPFNCPGNYKIADVTGPGKPFQLNYPSFGNSLYIDGVGSTTCNGSAIANNTDKKIWGQNNINLINGYWYQLSFYISSHSQVFNPTIPFKIKVKFDGPSNMETLYDIPPGELNNFNQLTFKIHCPASGNYNLSISQVDYFSNTNYNFFIDDISCRLINKEQINLSQYAFNGTSYTALSSLQCITNCTPNLYLGCLVSPVNTSFSYTYNWTLPNNAPINNTPYLQLQNPGNGNPPCQSGDYILQVVNNTTGCEYSEHEYLNYNPVVSAALSPNNCYALNASNITETLTINPGIGTVFHPSSITYKVDGPAGLVYSGSANTCTLSAIGTYTVTVSNGSSGHYCYGTTIITIKTNPNLTVTPPLNCTNTATTVTATATGGSAPYQYKLLPSGTYNIINTFNLNAPNTYTIAAKDNKGCTNTSTVTINTASNINVATQIDCINNVVILTASTNANNPIYSWQIGGNNYTASTVSTAAFGSAYSVTVSNSNTGCSTSTIGSIYATSAITNFCNCANTNSLSYIFMDVGCTSSQLLAKATAINAANVSGTTIGNINSITEIMITDNLNLNTNLTFINCKIQMAQTAGNYAIINCNGFNLTIQDNSVLEGCRKMWQGIIARSAVTNPQNTITINNSTINDMIRGVEANTAVVMANTSTFQNNLIGIHLINTTDNYITNIENCTFKTVNTLKAPNANKIGQHGIKITNCRKVNIGNTFNAGNTFLNLDNGIYVFYNLKKFNTPASVYNFNYNKFQQIIGGANVWDLPMWDTYDPSVNKLIYNDTKGCAIFANNYFGSQALTININGNPSNAPQSTYITNFDNCNKAVVINGTNCWIWNNKALHTNAGFLFNKMNSKSAVASENVLGNNTTDPSDGVMIGISKVGNDKSGAWGFHTDANDIKLKAMPLFNDDNMLQNKQISIGINSQYYSSNVGNTEAHNNRIAIPNDYNAVGIRLENATQSNYRYNKINFSNLNTLSISGLLAGIALQNAQNAVITNNAITGLNDPLFLNNHNSMGFYTSGSKGMQLNCNTADYLRFGIYNIENSSTGSYDRINSNRFTTRTSCILHRKLVNEGTLGNIGEDLNNPLFTYNSDNVFGGTNTWQRIMRFTNCAVSTTDKIVTTASRLVQSQSSTAPVNLVCNVKVSNPASFTTTYTACPLPVLQMVPIPPPLPSVLPYGTCDIGAMANGTPLDLQLARRIAGDSIDYIMMDEGGRWADERLLYQWLTTADETIRTDNPILDSFYLAMNTSNIKYITQFDNAIAILSDSSVANDSALYTTYLQMATTANNNINSELLFETNEKWINNMYLSYLEFGTDEWPTEDIMRIETLANSCPYIEGNAVYKARAIYAMFVPNMFFDNLEICNAVGVYRTSDSTDYQKEEAFLNADINANINLSIVNKIKIYPNPTHDQITVEYKIKEESSAQLVLIDMIGNVVQTIQLKSNNARVTAMLSSMRAGIYTYKYIIDGLVIDNGKLAIK